MDAAHSFNFLGLPVELQAHVAKFTDLETISSLNVVSKACQQMVKAQFKSIAKDIQDSGQNRRFMAFRIAEKILRVDLIPAGIAVSTSEENLEEILKKQAQAQMPQVADFFTASQENSRSFSLSQLFILHSFFSKPEGYDWFYKTRTRLNLASIGSDGREAKTIEKICKKFPLGKEIVPPKSVVKIVQNSLGILKR